ncbi:hypothetical protein YYG_02503 [Plasmodium vinckei petteri]|uniref:Uncharacterized protein n=1 Tax=Plasmodium vinckei petteri TaxID=138298 RepID=W7AGT5_PLAVN|nr:hypothetical protein YYG_02503 [Plasmodium vinckei petteri]CAD2109335.1 conserved Plasmodium protein, unknown function [Plasmodium vinckei petteri]
MCDAFEVTKLFDNENVSSHLIKLGSFNILCDIPLNPEEILNFKRKRTESSNNGGKKKKEEIGNEKKNINITNLESHSTSNKLLLDISVLPIKIHIILISCSECMIGLPILCKYFDLTDTQIICTKPTYTFSINAVKNLQEKEKYMPFEDGHATIFDIFNNDPAIDYAKSEHDLNEKNFNKKEYFDMKIKLKNSLHLLSYKEKISFKQNDETISISLYSSGYSLGSSNFFIEFDYTTIFIINKSSYNIKRYPSLFDSSCLPIADFVLFTSYLTSDKKYLVTSKEKGSKNETEIKNNFNTQNATLRSLPNESNQSIKKNESNNNKQIYNDINNGEETKENVNDKILNKINVCFEKTYKDSINKICSIVLKTIKKKGCVLIPVDLCYLYFLELVELIGVIISKYLTKDEQVLIFSIMPNINNIIHQADLCAEWVEESKKKKCSQISNPQGPFSIDIMIKNNRLIVENSINDASKNFRYPCVCFIQDSTLRFSEANILLEKWGMDQNNSIILLDPYYDPISVLYPYNIYEKHINVYYCPLYWDLNEMNILNIISTNKNKKSVYLLSHRLEKTFLKAQANNSNDGNGNPKIPEPPIENIHNTEIASLLKNNIIFIHSLEKKKIIYNNFLRLKKKMQPICFTSDGEKNLENVLTMIENNFYGTQTQCAYTSTLFGDYIKEEDIQKFIEHSENDGKMINNTMDNSYTQEDSKIDSLNSNNSKSKDVQIPLMFGAIDQKEFTNLLVQNGYSLSDLKIDESHNSNNTRNSGKIEYDQDNKHYDKSDISEPNYIWRIFIKSINSTITCYSKYDIEVFTKDEKLRSQVKDILQILSIKL